jgi:uncharacterized protein YaiI (UPF0178 family)
VITADIPLAAAVIEKGGHALDSRGEFFSKDNNGERLMLRNFMDALRSGGVETGSPSSFNRADRTASPISWTVFCSVCATLARVGNHPSLSTARLANS